jgi:choline dehydrogenase-like flavoprotein
MPRQESEPFNAIVIGTGFAGAVTACRLVEAGLRICVLERGRRYGAEDFPKYPTENLFAPDDARERDPAPVPDFSRWLWSRDNGLYDVRDLDHTVSVQAAAYGGGSLIYANVHLRPPRRIFDHGWPEEYANGRLEPYFDLAAYMLRASPIPTRLAKTLQLKKAAERLHGSADKHWFRTPLAVSFDSHPDDTNAFGREQHACDMRGRCFRGCDHLAKNTLDRNYLARAEDAADPAVPPDIRTLAEVTKIAHDSKGIFTVMYRDLLLRDNEDEETPRRRLSFVRGESVFLCAGSVNTTELLLRNRRVLKRNPGVRSALGAHYFPNTDSLAVVFDCAEPHEADYGPTITSALLYENTENSGGRYALDFRDGHSPRGDPPAAGAIVTGAKSKAQATLVVRPFLDWGDWGNPKDGAVGALALERVTGTFEAGEPLTIGDEATAVARTAPVREEHWFLAEDGGYPPDLEPLAGIFRSPLWLRRNRYLEPEEAMTPAAPARRAPTQPLLVQPFSDALGATSRRSASARGVLARTFSPDLTAGGGTSPVGAGTAPEPMILPKLFEEQVSNLFPRWFVTALENNRKELFQQATAVALPMLGRLLGDLSKNVAKEIDPGTLDRLGNGNVDPRKLEVLIRGVLRQGLQILAGSEAAVATSATRMLFENVPGTPGDFVRALGDLLLWALAYGNNDRHTGVLLMMGRDLYRGKLHLTSNGAGRETLKAVLANRVLDAPSITQERVLREIARGWRGELRTNPAWTSLGKRVTVHSQGGCPMGDEGTSVTNAWGEVHKCPGLYVMDAAAFPTSVGVNPSATIAAVAEFKIERFIRQRQAPQRKDREAGETGHAEASGTGHAEEWRAADYEAAQKWCEGQDRALLDPLNHAAVGASPEPPTRLIGLRFKEHMTGFVSDARADDATDWTDPDNFPERIPKFLEAENNGIAAAATLDVALCAIVEDLARLISPAPGLKPANVTVKGRIELAAPSWGRERFVLGPQSFVQLFLRPRVETVPTRFFRYHLEFMDGQSLRVMDALKVLRDSPGFDAWQDSSTLYFEIYDPHDPKARRKRGIVRVSLERFLREQLRSMTVTGTRDAARRSWALAAFYKYFGGQLMDVYASRTEALTRLLGSLLKEIHV